MPGHRATREGLDDDHAAAAVWAGMRLVAIGGIGRFGLWEDKQLTGPRDVLEALAAGEQAVVAGAMGGRVPGVGEGATGGLVGCERHRFVSIAAFDSVVLPPEGDAVVVQCDQAAVRDGNAMGVARQIGQDGLRAAERTL